MRCSIIVRSFKRRAQLMELLPALLRQSHRDHEVIVLDQSDDPALDAAVLGLGDARLRLIKRPPLGAPGARNEAIRHARGEILLFIDDDDLPLDDRWIEHHLRNYEDPACMGAVGRLTSTPTMRSSVRFARLIRRLAMTHTFLKDPRELACGPLRKRDITYLHGTNSSCRRELCERIGGWDEGIPPYGEEHSFAFRFARARRPGEHFVYDPLPVVWRRTNIAGGGDRRSGRDWYRKELAARVIFYHAIVGHYFPLRFRILYPLYLARIATKTMEWIWDRDNADRGAAERVLASVATLAQLPGQIWRHGIRLDGSSIKRACRVLPS